jgi:hypothetical protein
LDIKYQAENWIYLILSKAFQNWMLAKDNK